MPELGLGPDAKLIVTWDEDAGASRVAAISASLQQACGGPAVDLHRAVTEPERFRR